jgi:hypothetical protein
LIAKNLLTGSLKNRSIDNLETQKKSINNIHQVRPITKQLARQIILKEQVNQNAETG